MINLPKLAVLEQEMDRKDFIKYIGVGVLLLLGGNMIIGALNTLDKSHTSKRQDGYGSSPYGG